VEERTRELKSVESMQEDVRRRLESLAGATAETSQGAFRILQDLNQITGQLKRTIRSAKREVVAVASSRSLFRLLLDEGLEDELKAARQHGVRVRILTEILPGQEGTVERLLQFAEVRHLMVPRPLRFFVADDAEIVQYVTADPMSGGAKETALWIGASDHVQAQRAFFDDFWGSAVLARGRLEELRTGRPPPQVQLVKGRFTRNEKGKEMLMRAQREVLAYLTKGEAERLEKSGLKRAMESRAREGLRVRLLLEPGAVAPKLNGSIEVREAPAESHEVPTLLVDGAEALIVLTGESAAEKEVTALDESAVWLTTPAAVDVAQRRLEALWSRAG
jgi:sugar-specific transcriptional regulator TrmB